MKIKETLQIEDFKAMEKLEAKYYSEEFITNYEEAHSWYKEYDYTIKSIEKDGKIIGFINLFPITKEVYSLLKEGKFNDKYLELKNVIDLSSYNGKSLTLFLSCILIDKEYRKSDALQILLNEYMKFYKEVDKRFKIDKIIIDNVTRSGERFSERFGFRKVIESDHNSLVYEVGFQDFIKNVNCKSS